MPLPQVDRDKAGLKDSQTKGEEMKDGRDDSNITRRNFLTLAAAGIAGAAFTGFPHLTEAQEKKPKYGGRLRVSERYKSMGLDAHRNQDFIDYQNYCLMYSGLAEMGSLPQVEMHPMLAKSWEISKDGREYIFPLREGIKFHHGKELDSGDVKYSIERVMNPATRSPRAFAFRWIDSVQIIDKYHVKIKLKEPFAPFLTTLTVHNCSIIPAGWEPTGTKPAPGTGPFILKSFVPNETTEFTRFPHYWEFDDRTGDRLPYLDSIHVRKIVDATISWTALRSGDLDYVSTPPLNIMAKAILEKPVPGMFMDYDTPGNNWIFFNMTKPPFDNKKVRQAVAYAIDKKELVKAIYWGLGEPVNNQPFMNRSRFCIPVKDREPDLAKARQLLAEAGYPNGFKVEFLQFSLVYDLAGAEAVIGRLKQIGIEGTMKVIDRAPFMNMMRKGDYTITFRGDSERYDWDDAYFMFLHSSEIDKNNFSRYSNKEMDDLLQKGRATLKWEDRMVIYRRVVEIAMEDLPIFYISKPIVGVAVRDYVKGYRKGFAVRFGWHGGGLKYFWIDN
jgi:peptide/nickel transport system substrate-binding protein